LEIIWKNTEYREWEGNGWKRYYCKGLLRLLFLIEWGKRRLRSTIACKAWLECWAFILLQYFKLVKEYSLQFNSRRFTYDLKSDYWKQHIHVIFSIIIGSFNLAVFKKDLFLINIY
jgi:hypothetical protein